MPAVPEVMGPRPGDQVCRGPESKGQARQRPGCYGPPHPLYDLTQVIGAGDPAIQPALRNFVSGLALMAEMAEDPVCLTVDQGSANGETQTDQETGISQPACRVGGREAKEIAPVR